MQAIKIVISGRSFLLPDGFEFPMPEYIEQHIDMIKAYIAAGDEMLMLVPNFDTPEMQNAMNRIRILKSELTEFKARTGIIGTPFDSRDTDLYIAANHVEVISTINF